MKDIKIKPNNLILFVVLLISILPSTRLASFSMPFLYLLLPITAIILFFTLFGWIKLPKIGQYLLIIMVLILLENLLSAFVGTTTKLGKFIFPTDIIQYVARFLYLITFIVFFYYKKVSADTFIRYFLIFLNIGMLIGIMQWIPWPGREFFINLYPFRDGSLQLSQLGRNLSSLRMHGLAQMATSNGGLASFFFIFGFSVFKYYIKYRKMAILLMVLSIVNIFASMARAGMLALVFGIFLFYIVNIHITKKSFKPTLNLIIYILIIIFIGYILFIRGNPFIEMMVLRWNVLFDTKGGARVEQIKYFLSLFNSTYDYLFGLSKAFINQSGIPHGIEIEPANIFVTYGGLGFILQYLLVLTLLIYFFKNIDKAPNTQASQTLLIASFVGLFSYQVFSVGYYFFREINVGLFPWILMGVAIGVYENEKLSKGNCT